jgi:hypothetical protein
VTPNEIAEARREAMTTDELKAHKDRVAALYDCAIDLRKRFDRAVQEHNWDEVEAEQRFASLVFGDGTDGSDVDTLGGG